MPRSSKQTPWQRFYRKWKNCHQCPLHETRRNIVLARGSVPCDLLFIGEAPGGSEDDHGIPFIGKAGTLLDQMIDSAARMLEWDVNYKRGMLDALVDDFRVVRLAWTNLICCIPKGEDSKKGEPPDYAIKACKDRLVEFILVCRPRVVLLVGKLAAKYRPVIGPQWPMTFHEIVHPSAILQAPVERKGLMQQRATVTIRDALEGLG